MFHLFRVWRLLPACMSGVFSSLVRRNEKVSLCIRFVGLFSGFVLVLDLLLMLR